MPMNNDLIARLRDVMKRATPLPWAWEQCGEKCDDPVIGVAWRVEDESCTAVPGFLEDFDKDGKEQEFYRESIAYLGDANSPDASASANAMFMVEAVNALPGLLTALEKLGEALTYARRESIICGSPSVDFSRVARMKKLRGVIDEALSLIGGS